MVQQTTFNYHVQVIRTTNAYVTHPSELLATLDALATLEVDIPTEFTHDIILLRGWLRTQGYIVHVEYDTYAQTTEEF